MHERVVGEAPADKLMQRMQAPADNLMLLMQAPADNLMLRSSFFGARPHSCLLPLSLAPSLARALFHACFRPRCLCCLLLRLWCLLSLTRRVCVSLSLCRYVHRYAA